MTADAVVICKLIGDVISKRGGKVVGALNALPKLPPDVQCRIDSYPLLLRSGDDLLVALLASFELAWEKIEC
jgi:hypothetical protein